MTFSHEQNKSPRKEGALAQAIITRTGRNKVRARMFSDGPCGILQHPDEVLTYVIFTRDGKQCVAMFVETDVTPLTVLHYESAEACHVALASAHASYRHLVA